MKIWVEARDGDSLEEDGEVCVECADLENTLYLWLSKDPDRPAYVTKTTFHEHASVELPISTEELRLGIIEAFAEQIKEKL